MLLSELKGSYDLIIGLGSDCQTAYQMRRKKIRSLSSPIDWMVTEDGSIILDLLRRKFDGLLSKESLVKEDRGAEHYIVINQKNNIKSLHDFPVSYDEEHWLDGYAGVMERLNRQTKRLYSRMKRARRILVIRNGGSGMEFAQMLEILRQFTRRGAVLNILGLNYGETCGECACDHPNIAMGTIRNDPNRQEGYDEDWDFFLDGIELCEPEEERVSGLFRFPAYIKHIADYRMMIKSLVRRELRGRYKGTVLGFLWTFLNPLFQAVVYTLVFSQIINMGIPKYHVFLIAALIPWTFFAAAITQGAGSVLVQKEMVKKIYFPREVLPISNVTSNFINMALSFIVVFLIVIVSGIKMNPLGLMCLPVIMAVEYLLALGITMLVSALTVFFRDLEHILGIIVMAWQYLTPVLYSMDIVPDSLKPIFLVNPMEPVIAAYRDVLYYGAVPQLSTLLHAFGYAVALLILGTAVFHKLSRRFVEEM